ncbi:ABC transporter permease [Haliscomenobacter sp.]|uniref:ABC transporter permease n=1 Tax=Haliscomenobacter sp. TaxID=2717303 RepID=UPI003592F0A9
MKKRQGINSYWRNVWQRFRTRGAGRLALRSLTLFVIIALSSPFVANERPWYIKVEGKSYSPLLKGLLVDLGVAKWPTALMPAEDWADKTYDRIVFTLIPYSPRSIDHKNLNARGPFEQQRIKSWRFRHWMGTDKSGRDVAAGMLHGTRMALWLGSIMVGIAILMGLFLGGIAGYFGDQGLIVSKSRIWAILLFLPFLCFYLAYLPGVPEEASAWTHGFHQLTYLFLYLILVFSLDRLLRLMLPKLGRYVVPLDTLLMRLLEVVDAIPSIILVLALIATLEQPTTTYMMVVVGIVSSASVARFVRAEFLKVRQQTYMEAGRALGFTHLRLLFRHALPNALGPLLVLLSFSMAAAIVTESTLSILGIGAPDRVTWGSILGELRGQHQIEWWLALFPGLAIFFTVLTFRYLSEALSEALGEK